MIEYENMRIKEDEEGKEKYFVIAHDVSNPEFHIEYFEIFDFALAYYEEIKNDYFVVMLSRIIKEN